MRPCSFKRVGAVLAVLTAIGLLTAGSAWAHKIYVFAWVEGETVHVDAYFSKSKKVQGGKVQVADSAGNVLTEGATDDEGAFSFKVPDRPTDLVVTVDGGMGHKSEWKIAANELPGGAGAVEEKPAAVQEPAAEKPAPAATGAAVDPETLRRIVEEAVEAKIAPMRASLDGLQRQVAELGKDQGPGLVEILGGIGWIIGLMGLFVWLKRPAGEKA